jgi:tetratricopeptide (TPR) repeat protein
MTPVLRLVCAATLLAAYHYCLFPDALFSRARSSADAAALSDTTIRRDIDASEIAYSAGRFADALEPTRRLTEKMPSQAMYFDRLAHIYLKLGNRAEEARSWEGVFAVSPTPADACPMLAQAYEAANDVTRALGAFERCLDVEPDNPDALLLLGRAYQAAGRGDDARRVLEKAVAISPRYPDLYLLLGIRNYADGHIDVARQQFEHFLELSPGRREEVAVWLERTKSVAR